MDDCQTITVTKLKTNCYYWTIEGSYGTLNSNENFKTAQHAAGDAVETYYRDFEGMAVGPCIVLYEDCSNI